MEMAVLGLTKIFLAFCLIAQVMCQFPGPNVVTAEQSGPTEPFSYVEVWTAQTTESGKTFKYPVRDFDRPFIPTANGQWNKPLRPTLVYNCAIMKALCANARDYISRKTWTPPIQLHHDKDFRLTQQKKNKGSRSNRRRATSCPTNWVRTQVNGQNRCPPNVNRQQFYTSKTWQTLQDIEMYKEKDKSGQWVDSKNYLGRQTKKRDSSGNQVTRWEKTGIMLTCDEWPAASWIEGGGTSGNAASTICAPQNAACGGGPNGGRSEQDWQAYGHKNLGSWMIRNTPLNQRGQNNEGWTIYKFNFDLRTDTSANAPAVWVEAGGVRRYCDGPRGTKFYGCNPA